MAMKRRNHELRFKAKVTLDAVRGDKTIAEICRKYSVHSSQVARWKSQLLDHIPELSEGGVAPADIKREQLTDEKPPTGTLDKPIPLCTVLRVRLLALPAGPDFPSSINFYTRHTRRSCANPKSSEAQIFDGMAVTKVLDDDAFKLVLVE